MTQAPSTVSKKMKKNPLQFPQITCPIQIHNDLSVSEIQILKQYTNLALDWGYRSGVNNQHERFELESGKQSLVLVQKYTDILFRSLWAIEHKSRIYIDSDIIDKLLTCEDLSNQTDISDNVVPRVSSFDGASAISSFISRFVKQDFDLMYDLSHINLEPTDSPIFICIVASARALVLIATERQREAYESFQSLADCFL
jgi:hypothetical protein